MSGSTWSQQAKLTPSDEDGAGWFGFSVALSQDGDTALIGGPADDGFVGAAWLFGQTDSAWAQEDGGFTAGDEDNSSGGAEFGFAVALSSGATSLADRRPRGRQIQLGCCLATRGTGTGCPNRGHRDGQQRTGNRQLLAG